MVPPSPTDEKGNAVTSISLPNFEGRSVEALKLSVTGTIDDENAQPDRALKVDDTIVLIVCAQVVGVNHTVDKDGVVTRNQKVKVVEAHEVRGREGVDLLEQSRTSSADDDDTPTLNPTTERLGAA